MAKKEKKKRVKKCPSVWAPCVFGALAVVVVFFAIWTNYVGGPRIDTMSARNITTFWIVGVVMVGILFSQFICLFLIHMCFLLSLDTTFQRIAYS